MRKASQNSRGRKTVTKTNRRDAVDDTLLEPSNPGEDLLTPEEWAEVAGLLRLTPRELEVTVLTIEGRTRFAIARRLKLKARTVRQYFERVYRKLRVRDRLGLALRVVRARDYCSRV